MCIYRMRVTPSSVLMGQSLHNDIRLTYISFALFSSDLNIFLFISFLMSEHQRVGKTNLWIPLQPFFFKFMVSRP